MLIFLICCKNRLHLLDCYISYMMVTWWLHDGYMMGTWWSWWLLHHHCFPAMFHSTCRLGWELQHAIHAARHAKISRPRSWISGSRQTGCRCFWVIFVFSLPMRSNEFRTKKKIYPFASVLTCKKHTVYPSIINEYQWSIVIQLGKWAVTSSFRAHGWELIRGHELIVRWLTLLKYRYQRIPKPKSHHTTNYLVLI